MAQTSTDTVQPPFASTPHLTHPSGAGSIWFTEPAGAVIQLTQPTHVDAEWAHWLLPANAEALRRLHPKAHSFTLILDFTLMLSRDAEARKVFRSSAALLAPARVRVALIPPTNMSPMFANSISVLAALIAPVGVELRFEKTLALAESNYGLRAAHDKAA
jgi:hypothetical protein